MSKETKFHHVGDDASNAGDEFEVGYGRPPKSRQFKKGQSGNRKGRKPRAAYEEDDFPIRRYMMDPIKVKIGGKTQLVTKLEALLMRLVAQAMGGCIRSAKLLIEQSGGLKDFREEWKRQKSGAALEMVDEVLKMADSWLSASARKG
jgi:hypothetical protein